ncbi:unnamed protein product [Ectocarpus sp. 13 AM-2016]
MRCTADKPSRFISSRKEGRKRRSWRKVRTVVDGGIKCECGRLSNSSISCLGVRGRVLVYVTFKGFADDMCMMGMPRVHRLVSRMSVIILLGAAAPLCLPRRDREETGRSPQTCPGWEGLDDARETDLFYLLLLFF